MQHRTGIKAIEHFDDSYIKRQLFKKKEFVRKFGKYDVLLGYNPENNKPVYLDISTTCRILVLGMTRSGKSWILSRLNSIVKKADYATCFLTDVKDEMKEMVNEIQPKYRKLLPSGETPQGFKTLTFRPTFFMDFETMKELPKDNIWYSPEIEKIQLIDFRMLMDYDEMSVNQKIMIDEIFENITKNTKLESLYIFDEVIDNMEDLREESRQAMKFKLKPLQKSRFFDKDYRRDIVKAIKCDITVNLNLSGFDNISRSIGAPQLVVGMALREIINARRAMKIKPVWIFIDEASRFIPRDGNNSVKMDVMECLRYDTEIITNNGVKEIKDVNEEKDKILSFNFDIDNCEWKSFKKHGVKKKKLLKITLENGKEVICSKEHRLFIDGNYAVIEVFAQDLKIEDDLILTNVCKYCGKEIAEDKLKNMKITKIEELEEDDCYDLEVEDNHNFILANKVLSHNSVELDTRYGIGYIFATQTIERFPEQIISNCKYILVPYSADISTFKEIWRIVGLATNIQIMINEIIRVKRRLKKFDWVLVDKTTSTYTIVHPFAPLSAIAETDTF